MIEWACPLPKKCLTEVYKAVVTYGDNVCAVYPSNRGTVDINPIPSQRVRKIQHHCLSSYTMNEMQAGKQKWPGALQKNPFDFYFQYDIMQSFSVEVFITSTLIFQIMFSDFCSEIDVLIQVQHLMKDFDSMWFSQSAHDQVENTLNPAIDLWFITTSSICSGTSTLCFCSALYKNI